MNPGIKECVGLTLNVPSWFERQDFVDFLDGKTGPDGTWEVATWHTKGTSADEMSDVFILMDGGNEGSEMDTMPEDLWELLCDMIQEWDMKMWQHGGIVHLTNMPSEPDAACHHQAAMAAG
jgi:hypothetical protein